MGAQYDRNEDGPPDDLNELHWFIHKLMEKVGPNIDAIEIWNEPNLKREWTGNRPISGASYMELFRVGYDAVRAYSPGIASSQPAWRPRAITKASLSMTAPSCARCIKPGWRDTADVKIGVHPYSWGNPPDFLCCDNVEGQGWDDQAAILLLADHL